jgi:hypothetical protein
MARSGLLQLVLFFAAGFSFSKAREDKGILNLDSLTFEKIVGGDHPIFVRFDREYSVLFMPMFSLFCFQLTL